MDFFQNGTITTLHKLCDRPIEEMEAELQSFALERPMALILPSLYSELEGPALPKIVEDLKHATYIDDIIVGLDQADEKQFEHAKAFFSELPQNVHILWNDGPWLRDRCRAANSEPRPDPSRKRTQCLVLSGLCTGTGALRGNRAARLRHSHL